MRLLGPLLVGAIVSLTINASKANPGPATLLIIIRSDASTAATIHLTSLEDCEKTADHLAMVRSDNTSGIGVTGAWKRNFKDTSLFRQEPRLATICIPSSQDIPTVKEELLKKGWYRDIFQ